MPEAIGCTIRTLGDRLIPIPSFDSPLAHLTVMLIESYYECFHIISCGYVYIIPYYQVSCMKKRPFVFDLLTSQGGPIPGVLQMGSHRG
jgi:hypothetical protein